MKTTGGKKMHGMYSNKQKIRSNQNPSCYYSPTLIFFFFFIFFFNHNSMYLYQNHKIYYSRFGVVAVNALPFVPGKFFLLLQSGN